MLWSNNAGRVSRASVRCSATGAARRTEATASTSALPAAPSGATRAKKGQRRIAAFAAASSDAASTPGPGSMHSSRGSDRRCETSRSYRLWSIVTPPSSSLMPCAL